MYDHHGVELCIDLSIFFIQISMNVAVLAITSVHSVVSTLQEAIPVVVGRATLCSQMDALAKVTLNIILCMLQHGMLNQ